MMGAVRVTLALSGAFLLVSQGVKVQRTGGVGYTVDIQTRVDG